MNRIDYNISYSIKCVSCGRAIKANHCCQSTDPSKYYVLHNTISEGLIHVTEVIQHEDYSEEFLIQNDICILKTEPFVINETVQSACLGRVLDTLYVTSYSCYSLSL